MAQDGVFLAPQAYKDTPSERKNVRLPILATVYKLFIVYLLLIHNSVVYLIQWFEIFEHFIFILLSPAFKKAKNSSQKGVVFLFLHLCICLFYCLDFSVQQIKILYKIGKFAFNITRIMNIHGKARFTA